MSAVKRLSQLLSANLAGISLEGIHTLNGNTLSGHRSSLERACWCARFSEETVFHYFYEAVIRSNRAVPSFSRTVT